MQFKIYRLCISLVVLLITSCNMNTAVDDADGLDAFSKDSLANHVKILASDEFMGRKPFTQGETKTINYLRQEFIGAGLEPGNDTSYFQEVPMVNIVATADSTMHVHTATGDLILNGPDDYIIYADKTDTSLSFKNDEVVFAGYGVVAPEYNWNDYAGLDVRGKIVLVLVNDPGFNTQDTGLFKGREMTWYGRWPYKYAEAAKQGAKGCLIIHSDLAATYPFKVVQNLWNSSRLRLDMRGKSEELCDINGWISSEATKRLLIATGNDSTLLAKADQPGFVAQSLNMQFSTNMHVSCEYNKSHNVIGKITGSKYPGEIIIYSAHWDHLGIGKPDERGDTIYNGAVDNATGVAGLLEIARAFKHLKSKPERTIVFLSVTAEEQGLWGSDFYAQNPVYPIDKTVANLNMDMLNTWGKTNDIGMVGEGQNELEDYLKEEAAKENRTVTHDATPETGSYYRSDHFNFAKVGIPSLDLKYGLDVEGEGKDY
ncbi:MAG: M20/M25/M40 family metallo-hydrolase, partial [Ferruginibacter sp.]